MSASFVGRLSETGLFFRMSLLVSLLTSWMAHEIWMSLEPRRLKRRGVGWIPLPRDRKKTIGWFPKKPPVGKHSGKNEMRWISKQMNITDGEVHIRGHKHVFFQTMCFWYTFLVPYVDVLGSRMVCLTFGRAFSIQLCAGTQLFLKFEFLVKCHHFQRLVSLIFLEILSL